MTVRKILSLAAGLGLSIGVITAGNAAYFNYTQYINVTDSGWSTTCVIDFNTNGMSCTDATYGQYNVAYTLPYGAWKALAVYDFGLGKWDEIVYLTDENL